MHDLLPEAAVDGRSHERAELLAALEAQRGLLKEFLGVQHQRIQGVIADLAQYRQDLEDGGGETTDDELAQQLQQVCNERDELAEQLSRGVAEIERRREEIESLKAKWTPGQSDAGDEEASAKSNEGAHKDLLQELDDLQRRYEMALDDLKSERSRCAELEGQMAQVPASAPSATLSGAALDWEAQKRQLLASLESDFDADERVEDRRQERLTVQDTITRTDEVIAAKQREIDNLQKLLEEQSANFGSMAVGAAAVAEVLDKDEVVQQERQNLESLQKEWKDKLRQAEVEISVQRAKLARGQMELQEKTRQLEQQLRKADFPEEAEEAQKGPTRGRWLRRLGLKGGDDD